MGIDVIKFPCSTEGNQYVVVFMDYVSDQMARNFCSARPDSCHYSQILVEEIVSHHGILTQILSDRGKAFLSSLIKKIVKLLGIHQTNTTEYHPQTDGLVEQFNRTLTTMLVKTTKGGCD